MYDAIPAIGLELPAQVPLVGRHWTPAAPFARLLILHGYGDHAGRFAHVAEWMSDRGVACTAYDFRGHGRSPGRRGFVRNWGEYLSDLRHMLDAARAADASSPLPLFVLGHSHGGLVAAFAGTGSMLRDVAGVVLSAPYLAPAEPLSPLWRAIAKVTNVIAPAMQVPNGLSSDMMTDDPTMAADSAADPLLLRHATPRWYAGAVAAQRDVVAAAGRFTVPLLTLAGDADRVANTSATRAFVDAAGSADKTTEVISGGRHEILREAGRERTFERILTWIKERSSTNGLEGARR